MAHIIVTGATGLAGAAVLKRALDSPVIDRVSVLSRRPVKLAENQPKAHVIIHKDFENYPDAVLAQLKGATGCVWAQGASSMGMKEPEYRKLTVDNPLAAARAFSALGPKMNFVYVSGEGAEMDKTGGQMFARVKGEAEKKLLELQEDRPSLHVYNLRPGAINPEGNNLAERKPNMSDRAIGFLGFVLNKVSPKLVISTDSLAEVGVRLATGNGDPIPDGPGVEADGRVLRNVALKAMAKDSEQ